MTDATVNVEHVTLHYTPEKPVLRNISFALERGSFHFLTGRSGAGKSSLLSLLALNQRPTSGSITMFGTDVTDISAAEFPIMRRRIGVVFQDFQLLNHLSVAENIALPMKILGVDRAKRLKHSREMLEWIDMKDFGDVKPETLSGGQKQRVAIARAVMNKPEIILADEPTGNLDNTISMKCMHLFEALNRQGTTVLIASHDETLVQRMGKPVLKIRRGHIKRIEPPTTHTFDAKEPPKISLRSTEKVPDGPPAPPQ